MSPLKQQCYMYQGVVLKFYSFIDPISNKLWVTARDIANGLNYNNFETNYDYVLKPDMVTVWGDIIKSRSACELEQHYSDYFNLPFNWNFNTIMINEVGVSMLILTSPHLPNCAEFLKWINNYMFRSIKKQSKKCEQCAKKHDELTCRIYNLERRLKKQQYELNKCQKKNKYFRNKIK